MPSTLRLKGVCSGAEVVKRAGALEGENEGEWEEMKEDACMCSLGWGPWVSG